MNEEWVKFGARVANVRRKLELSQREVAFSLGMQPSEYDHLERGERDPDELLSGAFSILLREKELEGVIKALKKAVRERDGARNLAQAFHEDQTRLLMERDKAKAELADHKSALEIANRSADDQMRQKRLAERERDEARATLTSIHRWIERNHPDNFIDSLTYSQNLERVVDRWYDRLERVERERDEAMKLFESGKRGSSSLNEALDKTLHELREAREQNAKLRDLAERAVWRAVNGVCLPDASAVRAIKEEGIRLRAEFDQLKEGGK